MTLVDEIKKRLEAGHHDCVDCDHKKSQNAGQVVLRPTPSTELIEQIEPVDLQPFPVSIRDIVYVVSAPSKRQVWKATSAHGSVPGLAISSDPRIKSAKIWANVSGIYVGSEEEIKAGINAGNGYPDVPQLPSGHPIQVGGVNLLNDDLWMWQTAASVSANMAQPVYYVLEYWAD